MRMPPHSKCVLGLLNRGVIWAQLHAAGSNLAVCLRAGPELLGTVAWRARVGPYLTGPFTAAFARDMRVGDSDFGEAKPRFLDLAT
eukprot:scaffold11109_cov66-Phaeocystis_antarctica.AAC.1